MDLKLKLNPKIKTKIPTETISWKPTNKMAIKKTTYKKTTNQKMNKEKWIIKKTT